MIKRILVFFLALSLMACSSVTAFACDEEQSESYALQVLFGEKVSRYESNQNTQKILNALYLCSEQSNGAGQTHLNSLKSAKVGGVPTLAKININGNLLFDCSHNSWEYVSNSTQKAQDARRNLLRKTVINVFDFGRFNEIFKTNSGQIDSFAALLYYSHILADYLADDPMDTEISANGYDIPAYSGEADYELRGNIPSFTSKQKKEPPKDPKYSTLDTYKRAGSGIICIGPDTLESVGKKADIRYIYPSGWVEGNARYDGLMANELYNRCHLVAHSLGGADKRENLVTGTRYLNEAMMDYENQVAKYIEKTGNQVLYRVTPVYVGSNAVASGVQMEAYSIEDRGQGICFNVYLYNVQPGIDINYANGINELADQTVGASNIIPFAVSGVGENNPDLMYEIIKHLRILFPNQKNTNEYKDMMSDLEQIAKDARNVGGNKDWEVYAALMPYKYDFMETLTEHVPMLLAKEAFFKAAFK